MNSIRIFQNSGLYRAYIPRLRVLSAACRRFDEHVSVFLADRFGAAHFLEPVLNGDPEAFFTNGDDEVVQRLWASENGLSGTATLEAIMLAQIEHHRTEVFYNLDPLRYNSEFVRKLPGCVRKSFGWRAAPSPGADFTAYDLMLCNFPSILESYRERGWRAAYFAPAHDPLMDPFAANQERPVDVLFVGGYTRHHRKRAELLEVVASLGSEYRIHLHLDSSRLTRLAESPLGRLMPLAKHRRPATIRSSAKGPIFGLDLYRALSTAKVVLNGAIDMAGADRGNMRCFESMGCGAALLSDEGNYPAGMASGDTMLTWKDPADAVRCIHKLIQDDTLRSRIARAGHEMIARSYSKSLQWQRFLELAS